MKLADRLHLPERPAAGEQGAGRPSPADLARRFLEGDLASLRVILAIAVIWAVFQFQNDRFLSAVNLTNWARRSFGAGCRSSRPCATSRSTRPVMLPFDTISRCESSPSFMPAGDLSSCAMRSNRGKVIS